MAERGIDLPKVEVDIRGGENRQPGYLAKNPAGQCPALQLDDGSVIAEITAICEYLDETAPGASLIGATPQERAETRMWTRRIDLNILEPMANGFRYAEGLQMFQNRVRCIRKPRRAEGNRPGLARQARRADGRQELCLRRAADPRRYLLFAFVSISSPGSVSRSIPS